MMQTLYGTNRLQGKMRFVFSCVKETHLHAVLVRLRATACSCISLSCTLAIGSEYNVQALVSNYHWVRTWWDHRVTHMLHWRLNWHNKKFQR